MSKIKSCHIKQILSFNQLEVIEFYFLKQQVFREDIGAYVLTDKHTNQSVEVASKDITFLPIPMLPDSSCF